MYLEYILLIFDYFRTLTKRIFIFEWVLPLIITLTILFLNCKYEFSAYKNFKDNSVSIIGVLLGFSIAIITIITTGSGQNLENIKKKITKFKINKDALTLYDLILINFTYSVIIEIFIIVGCLVMPLVSSVVSFSNNTKIIFYSILVFSVLHILLVTLRNLTDFYFIVTKK
jgi:hypothetical protein